MQGQRLKLVIRIAFLLIASACAAPPAPAPGPLELVKALQSAWNQRDTAGALGLFADNPVWAWGFTVSGRTGLGNFIEYSIQLNGQWQFSACQLAGGAAACKAVYTDNCFPAELTGFHTQLTFEFRDGKIARVAGPIDPNEDAVLEKRHTLIRSWAATHLPADHARFVDAGEWRKFTGTGDQLSGKLTAIEFGQAVERMCAGYAEAAR